MQTLESFLEEEQEYLEKIEGVSDMYCMPFLHCSVIQVDAIKAGWIKAGLQLDGSSEEHDRILFDNMTAEQIAYLEYLAYMNQPLTAKPVAVNNVISMEDYRNKK